MAVITIKTVVGNLESVMRSFDRIKIYRSTTGLEGAYSEITDPTTRIPLESGKLVYEYVDNAGASGYYYKSSYFHSISLLESSLSEAQQGEGDAALDVISVDQLKTNYLFGIDLTNDAGEEMPDSLYEWFIQSAVSWLEHRLNIPIRPKPVDSEAHDFFAEDYRQYIWLKLLHYPVIEVEELRLVLPGSGTVQTFDRDWLFLERDNGQVQVVPGSGVSNSVLLGVSSPWLPFLYGMRRCIPGALQVDYTAGFEAGQVPAVIRDVVGKIASFGPLNIAGDLLGGAGIASQNLSVDGLSQGFTTTSSATNAGYGARLLQYSKEIKEVIPTLERHYKGIRLAVV